MSSERIIGIDPGSSMSGLCVLDSGRVISAFNLKNADLWDKLTTFLIHPSVSVALEVITPNRKPLDGYVVSTIEFIGEAKFRIRMACGENLRCVARYEVKKWVFDSFQHVALPLIEGKIDKKMFDACELLTRCEIRVTAKGKAAPKPTFVYVDDKIVSAVMKSVMDGVKIKGLSSHSVQAMALCCFVNSVNIKKSQP